MEKEGIRRGLCSSDVAVAPRVACDEWGTTFAGTHPKAAGIEAPGDLFGVVSSDVGGVASSSRSTDAECCIIFFSLLSEYVKRGWVYAYTTQTLLGVVAVISDWQVLGWREETEMRTQYSIIL